MTVARRACRRRLRRWQRARSAFRRGSSRRCAAVRTCRSPRFWRPPARPQGARLLRRRRAPPPLCRTQTSRLPIRPTLRCPASATNRTPDRRRNWPLRSASPSTNIRPNKIRMVGRTCMSKKPSVAVIGWSSVANEHGARTPAITPRRRSRWTGRTTPLTPTPGGRVGLVHRAGVYGSGTTSRWSNRAGAACIVSRRGRVALW
jgi:hypothetical protein